MERECVIIMVERSGRGVGWRRWGSEWVEEGGREGGRECVYNVMKERTEQEEVGAGREERRRGREGDRSGKGRR